MGVGAGLSAFNRHTPTSTRTGKVGREIQIEKVAPGWQAVRRLGVGAGTDCQNLVRTRPVKREFGLEHLVVRVRLHTLADYGGRVIHPCPTTRSDFRCRTQRVGEGGVGEGGVSAINTRNGEDVMCTNNAVRALLAVGVQVAIAQLVAGQTLMSQGCWCRRKPSGGDVGVYPCGPRWSLGPSPR